MAFSERVIIKSISVQLETDCINVMWSHQVLKDEDVIHEVFRRKAYTSDKGYEFMTEVEGWEPYIAIMGWSTELAT